MQFGIMLPHYRHVASTENIKKVSQEAEKMGFASLWITDRTIIFPGEDEDKFGVNFYDPFATLSYVAAITDNILLGESVIVVPYRNPFMLARMTATIDALSKGRHIFGVGVSGGSDYTRDEFRLIDAPMENRGLMTDEAIEVMIELWTNENPSFYGSFWEFENFCFEPKPVQKPYPPIWIGGNRPVGLKRAVKYGDAWHPSTIDLVTLEAGVKYLQQELPENGREFNKMEIAPRESIKILEHPSSRLDFPLIGDLAQVLNSLEKYQNIGATHMVLDTFFGRDGLQDQTVDSMLFTMEIIAKKIFPVFQS